MNGPFTKPSLDQRRLCSSAIVKSVLLHVGVIDNHARHRTAVFLLFRRVNAMGSNVDSKAMYFPLNGKILELTKVIGVLLLKHRKGAAGTSDVDTFQSGIEFDDISSSRRGEVGNRFVSIK